jgi:glutathione S-transferase
MGELLLHNYDLDENCYKVRLFMALLGLAPRLISVDAMPGREHEKPEYRALNPLATLPLLTDGALRVFGAEAILAHLARSRDPSAAWLPTDGEAFARTMIWLTFSAGALQSATTARREALFNGAADDTPARAAAGEALRVMEDVMTGRRIDGADWFAAPHPTIADVALFPAFALSRDFNVDHDEFPALRLWARRLRRLPGFITMPGIPDYH